MTLLDVISVLVFLTILGGSIALRLYLKRQIKDADGMGEVQDMEGETSDNVATIDEVGTKRC